MDSLDSLRVMFLASEADPFVKVGGLGDVAGSLPPALRAVDSGLDVRLVIPYHGQIYRKLPDAQPVAAFEVPHLKGPILAEVSETELDGLPVYLIGGGPFPADAPVYTGDNEIDGFKYTFFSLAALDLARFIGWQPHLLHANDWHTALSIYALSLHRPTDPFYQHTSTLLGVHNLPYLGVGAGPVLAGFGLPPADPSPLPEWAREMPLPLGLLSADAIVAVSPTYAQEILTPEFGSGLSDFLSSRSDSITGILNGLDLARWDPATDSQLKAPFSLRSLKRRAKNKAALQAELGLEPAPDVPLLGMITRMDYQKGIDIAVEALRQISDLSWQAVILGTGVPEFEQASRQLQADFPNRVRAEIRFDSNLSRRIYGGVDALLIPSRYEPCGLTQMIAMRYGCVPIARATGGLRDTIVDRGSVEEDTGFLFSAPSPVELAGAIRRAIGAYQDEGRWQKLQKNGMHQDFSWTRSAREYLQLYQTLAEKAKV